jgi:hypothetical protein
MIFSIFHGIFAAYGAEKIKKIWGDKNLFERIGIP